MSFTLMDVRILTKHSILTKLYVLFVNKKEINLFITIISFVYK